MNILDEIISHKRKEVAERKTTTPVKNLENRELFTRKTLSLREFLLDASRTGIITEFKRRSPSKGVINDKADVAAVTADYTQYGAAGLSILTDEHFFGGSMEDLIAARGNKVPLLRKDFVIDEYQIIEARAIGADAILLIAACLDPSAVKRLASFAKSLQLEVLLELHGQDELDHICEETVLVGINNRNLKTFSVDINHSLEMAAKIPGNKVKVAESGISSAANIRLFKEHGFNGFLIGENFMKEDNPGLAFKKFVDEL